MLYSVTVCTHTHTHTCMLLHSFSPNTYSLSMLTVTKFTHNQWHYVQMCDTKFHPYWKNLTVRQKFIMSLTTPIFTKLTIMQYSLWTYPVPYFTQTRKNHRQLGQHFYYISTQKSMAFTAVTVTVTKHTIPN